MRAYAAYLHSAAVRCRELSYRGCIRPRNGLSLLCLPQRFVRGTSFLIVREVHVGQRKTLDCALDLHILLGAISSSEIWPHVLDKASAMLAQKSGQGWSLRT